MIPFLSVLLLIVGLTIFSYPLYRRRTPPEASAAPEALLELQERYRNALADLQDAETDWQIGNLSADDYARVRERHRRVAAEALRSIDTITDIRERVRAELEREIAAATSARLVEDGPRPPSANGAHYAAAEVVPIAWREPRRRLVATPVLVALGLAVVAIAAIVGLYVRTLQIQASQTPLATLPISHAHTVVLDDSGIWVGHHNGLLRSDDGRAWEAAPIAGEVMAYVRAPGGGPELALGHDVLMTRAGPRDSWLPLEHDLPGTDVHGAGVGGPGLYAYVENWGLFRSKDAHVWEPMSQPLREGVNALAVMPGADGDDVFVVTGGTLLRSRDGGRIWTSAGGAASMALVGAVQTVAADPMTRQLYAGTVDGLYRSSDNGASWTRLPFRGAVSAVAARGERIALVDDERHFFLSRDGGGSWSASP